MKTFLKATMCVAALAATTAMAGSFPFPQNMKSPHGYTIPFADTDMIKDHFNKWKKAWYQDKGNEAWVLAPEGTCSTVSEAIAYGMLITVYMDEQSMFDKLYATWKNNGGNGGGMNWRIGCDGGSGSASDADFDAALALVMADKQWGGSYLSDAKKIISWIATNDTNLPDGTVDQVFDRFTRLDNAKDIPGAGLGLSHVKEIVKAHNGRASAKVEYGVFTLRISL